MSINIFCLCDPGYAFCEWGNRQMKYISIFFPFTGATNLPTEKQIHRLHKTQGNAFNIFVIKWHPLSLCSCISRRPLPALLSNLIISFNSDLVLKVLARTEKKSLKDCRAMRKRSKNRSADENVFSQTNPVYGLD